MSSPEFVADLQGRIKDLENALLEEALSKRKSLADVHESRISWLGRWFNRIWSLCFKPSAPAPDRRLTAATYFASSAAIVSMSAGSIGAPQHPDDAANSGGGCLPCCGSSNEATPGSSGCVANVSSACAPVCMPESKHVAFDPLFDTDNNPWHDPVPDDSQDSRRVWQTGLYWSFMIYTLACLGLLIAHVVIFGLNSSIQAAYGKSNPCVSVHFITVGNLAGLALAPGILLLVRLLIFIRDQLMAPCSRCLRAVQRCWRCCCVRPYQRLYQRLCSWRCVDCFFCCCLRSQQSAAAPSPTFAHRTLVSYPSRNLSININIGSSSDAGASLASVASNPVTDATNRTSSNAAMSGSSHEPSASASSTSASASSPRSGTSGGGGGRARAGSLSSNSTGGRDEFDTDDEDTTDDSNSDRRSDEFDDKDDDDDGAVNVQTKCDQAIVYSGNLLLVLAVLDVIFFTVWNVLSPIFLTTSSGIACQEISPQYTNVNWITSIILYVFWGELAILWVLCQLYGFCTQKYGLCLSQDQRDRMQLRRLSEKFDRDLQADAQRRKGVRRMLLLGPPGAGKRQFLNLLARAIHAGKLPGLHLLQFSGLKQKGGSDTSNSLLSLPRTLVDCFKIPRGQISLPSLFSSSSALSSSSDPSCTSMTSDMDSTFSASSFASNLSNPLSSSPTSTLSAHHARVLESLVKHTHPPPSVVLADASIASHALSVITEENSFTPRSVQSSSSSSASSASSASTPSLSARSLSPAPRRADWLWFGGIGPDISCTIMEFSGPDTLSQAVLVCSAWFVRWHPHVDRLFAGWMESMLTLQPPSSKHHPTTPTFQTQPPPEPTSVGSSSVEFSDIKPLDEEPSGMFSWPSSSAMASVSVSTSSPTLRGYSSGTQSPPKSPSLSLRTPTSIHGGHGDSSPTASSSSSSIPSLTLPRSSRPTNSSTSTAATVSSSTLSSSTSATANANALASSSSSSSSSRATAAPPRRSSSSQQSNLATVSKRAVTRQALCAWDRFFHGTRREASACRTLRLYDTMLRGEVLMVVADFPQRWPPQPSNDRHQHKQSPTLSSSLSSLSATSFSSAPITVVSPMVKLETDEKSEVASTTASPSNPSPFKSRFSLQRRDEDEPAPIPRRSLHANLSSLSSSSSASSAFSPTFTPSSSAPVPIPSLSSTSVSPSQPSSSFSSSSISSTAELADDFAFVTPVSQASSSVSESPSLPSPTFLASSSSHLSATPFKPEIFILIDREPSTQHQPVEDIKIDVSCKESSSAAVENSFDSTEGASFDDDDDDDDFDGYGGFSVDEAVARAAKRALAAQKKQNGSKGQTHQKRNHKSDHHELFGRRRSEGALAHHRPHSSARFPRQLLDALTGVDDDVVGVFYVADLLSRPAIQSNTSKPSSSQALESSSSSASSSPTFAEDVLQLQSVLDSLSLSHDLGQAGRATPRLVCLNNRTRFAQRAAAFAAATTKSSFAFSSSAPSLSSPIIPTASLPGSGAASSVDADGVLDTCQRRLASQFSSLLFAVNDRPRPDTDDVINMFTVTWKHMFPQQAQRWQQ